MKNKIIIVISLFLLIGAMVTYIFTRQNMIDAYYIHNASLVRNLANGKMQVAVEEENEGTHFLRPGEEIAKNPVLTNTGDLDGYVRAQVYIPVANIKYIETIEDNEVVKTGEVELLSLKKIGLGWEEVTTEGFSGEITDENGNKYKVYTYKYMENGEEKVIEKGEKITTPVFEKVKLINYVDPDTYTKFKVVVKAISVQKQNGSTAEQMWTYYKNQKGSGIGEVN